MRVIEETLRQCGALLKGHFSLTSGKHSDYYLEKAEICADPIVTADLCWDMAQNIVSQFKAYKIEVVVGLAPIGVILSNRVAEYLGEIYQSDVTSVFTEKDEADKMIFRRGYSKKISGKRVLIVDDILTTGSSVGQVKKEIERLGGEVVGAAVIYQRGKVRSENLAGTPLLSLADLKMNDWLSEDCPLCKANIPLTDPKSR